MSTNAITLTIEAKGEIISSNFPAFAEQVREHLATFNRELVSDDDFDQANEDAKAIAAAESSLKSAKEKVLADAEQLNALFDQIDCLTGDLASARLDLTRQIAKRKEERKAELIEEAIATLDIDPRDARNNYLKGCQEAIKGKRTIESMATALRSYIGSVQGSITICRKLIADHGDLVHDSRELEMKGAVYVEGELRRRAEAKKAAEEAARLREEAAKAKAEADALKAPQEPDKKNPHNLPPPPKIGSISVGSPKVAPLELSNEVTVDEEWRQLTATVKSAFGLIKEHRERLTHEENQSRILGFGVLVNEAWKRCQEAQEVES